MTGNDRHWHTCNWCGAGARRIGAVETGMWRWHGSVWLCIWPGCGHEMELWDMKFPLEYWREQMIQVLEERWRCMLIARAILEAMGAAK